MLIDGRRGAAGDEPSAIGKHVRRWVIIVIVVTNEPSERKQSCRTDQVGPDGRDVVSLDLRALIRLPNRAAGDRVGYAGIGIIVGVGCLKPGTAIAKVHMDRVRTCRLKVDSVEQILFIAFVVDGVKFGRIQESAGVPSTCSDELSP